MKHRRPFVRLPLGFYTLRRFTCQLLPHASSGPPLLGTLHNCYLLMQTTTCQVSAFYRCKTPSHTFCVLFSQVCLINNPNDPFTGLNIWVDSESTGAFFPLMSPIFYHWSLLKATWLVPNLLQEPPHQAPRNFTSSLQWLPTGKSKQWWHFSQLAWTREDPPSTLLLRLAKGGIILLVSGKARSKVYRSVCISTVAEL